MSFLMTMAERELASPKYSARRVAAELRSRTVGRYGINRAAFWMGSQWDSSIARRARDRDGISYPSVRLASATISGLARSAMLSLREVPGKGRSMGALGLAAMWPEEKAEEMAMTGDSISPPAEERP